MRFLKTTPEFDIAHLIRDLAWDTRKCPGLVVDVGGGDGSIAAALVRKFPSVKCIVQDVASPTCTASVPDAWKDRLQFQCHNMFTEQPVQSADVYFFRSTFHDWSDKYAIQILRNLIPALKNGVRIIANEVCIPTPNTSLISGSAVVHFTYKFQRGYDLTMKQLFNSKERSAQEWMDLFAAADNRFSLERIISSPGSILAVIEGKR
ncbi:S-adenosyl-L-methionine-dependent methyltransferase [Mytilinidion resinicola]|uniref:S-adenosyl-L-methionine-dependent methyltransferase n=1 Tax=Mytilinidion resinicola TaxID=574789 RepID=A0A6A6YLN8_9PEZI|nr:S-adenosyl-L-methionine-dependent methyltransferase [Mytilinidion resinicola]KAF2809792.1 S-adenosyl-L-methionine-dependent methyltransferase [Mytilinidion resinicola]